MVDAIIPRTRTKESIRHQKGSHQTVAEHRRSSRIGTLRRHASQERNP